MVYNRPQNPATPTFSAHLKSVYNFFEPTKVSFFHQNANTSPENFPNFLFSSPCHPAPCHSERLKGVERMRELGQTGAEALRTRSKSSHNTSPEMRFTNRKRISQIIEFRQ